MEKSILGRERRKGQRKLIDLPLEYRIINGPYAHGGLMINVSETGLLLQSIKNIPVGTKLDVAVLFPRGYELASFKVLGEIIWKDLLWKEDWEGYQYGLKFIQIREEDYQKLKHLLNDHSSN